MPISATLGRPIPVPAIRIDENAILFSTSLEADQEGRVRSRTDLNRGEARDAAVWGLRTGSCAMPIRCKNWRRHSSPEELKLYNCASINRGGRCPGGITVSGSKSELLRLVRDPGGCARSGGPGR